MVDYHFPLLRPHQFVIHMKSFIENSNEMYFISFYFILSYSIEFSLFLSSRSDNGYSYSWAQFNL